LRNKTSKRIVILLILFIPMIYFGLRVFIDIHPKVNPNIDYYYFVRLSFIISHNIFIPLTMPDSHLQCSFFDIRYVSGKQGNNKNSNIPTAEQR